MTPTHRIPAHFLSQQVRILVIGCGGTGAAFASGLPYLHQAMLALGHPAGIAVTVADGDLISESNCVRQPFSVHEIGRNKAETLVSRINLYWGLAWTAHPEHVTQDSKLGPYDIVIGCVDSRKARALIAAKLKTRAIDAAYWMDAGNESDFGQIVIGEPHERSHYDPTGTQPKQPRLPTVAEMLPQMVEPGRETGPSCSAAEALTRQAPFTNHVIAHHMLFMLGQMFRTGGLDHNGLFLNLRDGSVSRVAIDPAQWAMLRGEPEMALAA